MLLKIWPHLTFGWPFVNISLTIHPTHSKLYIFVILITSRVIWYIYERPFETFWKFNPPWPLRDPYWEGAKSSKILSKYFLTYNDFKPINNSFSSKWHLSTSSTTSSIISALVNYFKYLWHKFSLNFSFSFSKIIKIIFTNVKTIRQKI